MSDQQPADSPNPYAIWSQQGEQPAPLWLQGVVALFAIGALVFVVLNLWPASLQQDSSTPDPSQGPIVQARYYRLPIAVVQQRARMLEVMEPSGQARQYELYAYVDALKRARQLLRNNGFVVQNEDLLEAVADALQAGGRPDDIHQLLEQSGGNELVTLSFFWSYLQKGWASPAAAEQALQVSTG